MPRIVNKQGVASQALYFGYGSNLSSSLMAVRCPHSTAVGLGFLPDWAWLIDQSGFANIVPSADADDNLPPGVYGVLYRLTEEGEERLDFSEGLPRSYDKMLLGARVVEGTEKFEVTGDSEGRRRRKWYNTEHPSDPFAAVDAAALSDRLGALLAGEQAAQGVPAVQTHGEEGTTAESSEASGAKIALRLTTKTTQSPPSQHQTIQVFAYVSADRMTPSPPRHRYIGRINTGIVEASARWGLPEGYVDQVLRPFIPARQEKP